MHTPLAWCAIGDSFTYLNDHLDETGYRVTEGYIRRACRLLPELALAPINIGINGSSTKDWLRHPIPAADLYTILLGTNDWHQGIPLGTTQAFDAKQEGTILGNLAILIDHVRRANPSANLLVMNPVERGDFVCISNALNNAHGSDTPDGGQYLADIAHGIYVACRRVGVPVLDLHTQSGFSVETAVRFKRVKTPEGYQDLPYPAYRRCAVDFAHDAYPYPPEAANMTYDGLHPSDKGNQRLAELLAARLRLLL